MMGTGVVGQAVGNERGDKVPVPSTKLGFTFFFYLLYFPLECPRLYSNVTFPSHACTRWTYALSTEQVAQYLSTSNDSFCFF